MEEEINNQRAHRGLCVELRSLLRNQVACNVEEAWNPVPSFYGDAV
jgi:hypothetical protein